MRMKYDSSFRRRYGSAPVAVSTSAGNVPTYPHIHCEIEMLYILDGTSEVVIAQNLYRAEKGDVFFINPFEVHAVRGISGAAYRNRCICFDHTLIADRKLAADITDGTCAVNRRFGADDALTKALIPLFNGLFEAVEENRATLLFDATAAVSGMFSLFLQNDCIAQKEKRGKKQAFPSKVLHYLSAHFAEDIRSGDAAAALFYNQSYFCRSFKQHFGVPFSEYVTMYRLLKAKELLRDTDMNMTAVASACGFSSGTYFCKCFKKHMKATPSQYKKSIQN